MKKFTSLFLVLIFCFSMSATAMAASPAVDSVVSTAVLGEGERVVLTERERAAFEASENNMVSDPDSQNAVVPRVSVGAGIAEIIGYPLLADLNTGELFYYTNIGRMVTYSSVGQFSSLRLTAAQVQQVYNEALTYLENNIPTEGHSYAIVGWYISTLVQLRADNPRYIEYRIAEPNFGQGTEYVRENIPYSIISYRITGACAFPSNASTTEYFHIGGAEGTFYYATDAGKVLGIPFSAGIALNVQS